MPKLSDIRRIIVEDFQEEDQDMASKISGSYNEFADELFQVINGQLDFDNLNRSKIIYEVQVDANGAPKNNPLVNSSLASVSGVNIIKCDSLENKKLKSAPFLQFTYQGNGLLKVDYILGLEAGRYRIVLEIIA